MEKKFFSSLLLVVLAVSGLFAQNTDVLIDRIKQANSSVNTIESDFKQVKTLKLAKRTIELDGKLFYDRNFYLNMTYPNEKNHQILIDNSRFFVKNGAAANRFNTDKNGDMRLFRNALINSFVGNIREIADENRAEIDYSKEGDSHVFTIVNKADKRKLYNGFVISYDVKTMRMTGIRILESNGNYTDYSLIGTAVINRPFSVPQKRTR